MTDQRKDLTTEHRTGLAEATISRYQLRDRAHLVIRCQSRPEQRSVISSELRNSVCRDAVKFA